MSDYDAEAFDAFGAAGWGSKDASAYDQLAGRVMSRLAEPPLDAVVAGPGTQLLDVATGSGYLTGAAPPADVPPGPPLFRFAEEAEFTGLLEGAGLQDVRVDTVDFTLSLESADALWDGLVEGSVRVRPLVFSQSEEMRRAIRARYDELLEEYRTDDGFDVPVAVKLAHGRKP